MAIYPPISFLEKTYALRISRITPMGKHLLVKAEQPRRLFLLKALDVQRAKHAGEALRHLARCGLQPSPMWQLPLTGQDGLLWHSRCWVLIPWQHGTTAPVFTKSGFPRLLQLLNQVHEFGRSATVGRLYDHGQHVAKGLVDLEQVFGAGSATGFSRLYRKNLPHYLDQAKTALKILKQRTPVTDKTTLCHGDPAPKNTLVLGDGRWILIDWDMIVRAHRWWELAHAIGRFSMVNSWKTWPIWDHLDRALPRTELTSQEKTALWASLVFPQAFWRLGYQYYREKLPRPESWYLDRLNRILRCERQRQVSLHLWLRELC